MESAPIDILVNNAGIHDDAPFPGMSREQWHRVIDVSLHGFYNVTRPLVMPMVRARWGRIISITSVAAEIGNRGQANYAAAKGGLHSASRSLARELGSRGVTVNCVSPGIIATPMSEGAFTPEKGREPRAAAAHGTARRRRRRRGLPRLRCRLLHHRPGHSRQRRDGLGSAAAQLAPEQEGHPQDGLEHQPRVHPGEQDVVAQVVEVRHAALGGRAGT